MGIHRNPWGTHGNPWGTHGKPWEPTWEPVGARELPVGACGVIPVGARGVPVEVRGGLVGYPWGPVGYPWGTRGGPWGPVGARVNLWSGRRLAVRLNITASTGDAMAIDTSVAKRVSGQCLWLAGPGVLLGPFCGHSPGCFDLDLGIWNYLINIWI